MDLGSLMLTSGRPVLPHRLCGKANTGAIRSAPYG